MAVRKHEGPSLQERFAPRSICFGCGPANPAGLVLASYREGDACVADWQPGPHHEAFEEILAGGVIGALLDCHANWTAATHLMESRGQAHPPATVTAELALRFLRPTPSRQPVRLLARVVVADGDRAQVEAELSSEGVVTATCRGTFVAVGPGHPAFGRWAPDQEPAGPDASRSEAAGPGATRPDGARPDAAGSGAALSGAPEASSSSSAETSPGQ